jgi:hypothetical protein
MLNLIEMNEETNRVNTQVGNREENNSNESLSSGASSISASSPPPTLSDDSPSEGDSLNRKPKESVTYYDIRTSKFLEND